MIRKKLTIKKKHQQSRRFYHTPRWVAFSKFIRLNDKFCYHCNAGLAEVADHTLPLRFFPDLAFDFKNVRGICRKCDNLKRQAEIGEVDQVLKRIKDLGFKMRG